MNSFFIPKSRNILSIVSVFILLGGCSTSGPGFANHPMDCAIGIPWADCLPGTRGYSNGGGSAHKEAAKKVSDEISDQYKSANDKCVAEMQTSELEPISHKIEFMDVAETPVPFEIASNNSFPSANELPLIAKLAKIRDGCINREHEINYIPNNTPPLMVAYIKQEHSFNEEAETRVSELIVALYQLKLSYGEFAQKRHEIDVAAASAQRQYRETKIIEDQQRQLQAQQLASERFKNNMTAWSAYMQTLNARQPQSIHCNSYQSGNMVNTNCN